MRNGKEKLIVAIDTNEFDKAKKLRDYFYIDRKFNG